MKKSTTILLIVLTALTLISLALNGVIIVWLLHVRQVAVATVQDVRVVVAGIGREKISTTIRVEQEIPITASSPIYEEIVVPINTTIPIDTDVIVPINAGLLGTFEIDVPIRTVIPVDIDVVVPIRQTVDIATTVPLQLELPLEVSIAETPLADYLDALDTALAQAETSLAQPLGGEGRP